MVAFKHHILAIGCYFAATVSAVSLPAPNLQRASQPLAPSSDPWYTAPPGFEIALPGTILRIRPAPGNLTTAVPNTSAAYNILYRTTDSNYQPAWAVTTLFVPSTRGSHPSTPSLLSLQFAYDSADVDSSPSYGLYYSYSLAADGIPSSTADVSDSLGNGWYVNVPDYEGPKASFGLGISEGHATLDSVRAVLLSKIIPQSEHAKYALWGYSGGSLASEWASELQAQYAPELSFAGAAFGGLVPNFTDTMDNITATPYAGLIPSGILGSTSQSTEARNFLLSRLKQSGPYTASNFLKALKQDIDQDYATFAFQDVYNYLIGGRADLQNPILLNILNNNGYLGNHGVPRFPVFAYKAIQDAFSKVKQTDALVQKWCAAGTAVWYQRNTVGGHIAEITNGRGRALAWLQSIFDGTYKPKGCLVQNVTVAIVTALDV